MSVTKTVLTPSGGATERDVLGSLRTRLSAADDDTRVLMRQLIDLGAPSVDPSPPTDADRPSPAVTPFRADRPPGGATAVDDVIGRLCQAEALIAALKSSVTTVLAGRRSAPPLAAHSDATSHQAAAAVAAKRDRDEDGLMQHPTAKAEIHRFESSTLRKSQRWVSELKERLAHEVSLRASLETMQRKLLEQVGDSKTSADASQQKVRELDVACLSLKREVAELRAELRRQSEVNSGLHQQLQEAAHKTGSEKTKLSSLEEDKRMLMREVSKMRSRYAKLSEQLDVTRKRIDERQASHEELSQKQIKNEVARLQCHLSEETEAKTNALMKCQSLEDDLATVNVRLAASKQQLESRLEVGGREKGDLEEQVVTLEKEKQQALEEKDALIDEVSQAVDAMSEERERQQAQLEQVEAENCSLQQTKQQLQEEIDSLLQRITVLSDEQRASSDAASLAEDEETENARLAAEVDALAAEVASLEAEIARRDRQRPNDEVTTPRDAQVAPAVLARLTAAQATLVEEHGKLLGVQSDNVQLTMRVSSLTAVQAQLQLTTDQLRWSSGQKDEALDQLKLQWRQSAEKMEAELAVARLQAAPLRQALEQCRHDNAKMAASLETLLESNNVLRKSAEDQRRHLVEKSELLLAERATRDREQKSSRQEVRSLSERLSSLDQELRTKREKGAKRNKKEALQVRRQTSESSSRVADVARRNGELRRRVNDLDGVVREQTAKLATGRAEADRLRASQRQQARARLATEEVKDKMVQLEKLNMEHEKHGREQSLTIESFVSRVSSLKCEAGELKTAQTQTAAMLDLQTGKLEAEQAKSRRLEEEVKASGLAAEESRLQISQTSNDSLQFADSLKETELAFKTNIDKLQVELDLSRSAEVKLSRENSESQRLVEAEKWRANETMERAKSMIKTSRQTIHHLADYAEESQRDALHQLRSLQRQLSSERSQKEAAESRLHSMQSASLRLTEELAGELNDLRMSSFNR